MKRKDVQLELNQMNTTIDVFMELYNKTIPRGFPVASMAALKKFQERYPLLFKNKEEWSIEKHRKRLIEWLGTRVND